LFSKSFRKLTDLNVNIVSQSIQQIVVPEAIVSDSAQIKEFMDNADKDFFTAILKHLDEQKKKFTIKPFILNTTEYDQEQGAPATVEIPITLDQSNFFA
jgi:hypothetical protein